MSFINNSAEKILYLLIAGKLRISKKSQKNLKSIKKNKQKLQ